MLENPRNQAASPEHGQAEAQPAPQLAPEAKSKQRSILKDPIPWVLLVLTLGLDQLTKSLVIANLDRGESWPADGFFRITHAWNTGTAFSLFQDQSNLLTIVSFVAVIALYFVYRTLDAPNIWVRMAFGLLLGGAFGNLIDRLRLGHVTDFADIGPWPIFNIADSAIVVGITVLFLNFWMTSERSSKKEEAAPPAESGSSSQGAASKE